MQLYLRPFFIILRRQNNFEWTTEHQKRFEAIKIVLTEQISLQFQTPINHFMQCAELQILVSAVQHCYNLTMERIK